MIIIIIITRVCPLNCWWVISLYCNPIIKIQSVHTNTLHSLNCLCFPANCLPSTGTFHFPNSCLRVKTCVIGWSYVSRQCDWLVVCAMAVWLAGFMCEGRWKACLMCERWRDWLGLRGIDFLYVWMLLMDRYDVETRVWCTDIMWTMWLVWSR